MNRRTRSSFRPRLEALEERWCPSTTRPIADFLNAQGQTSLFPNGANPGGPAGLPDEIGWTKPVAFDPSVSGEQFARVDYTGQDAAFLLAHYGIKLGTTTSGTISERVLADGTAEDTVNLHTHNAFAWANVTDAANPTNPPVSFGYLPSQLVANPSLSPPLADSDLQVVIRLPHPGAPLPDLVENLILGNDPTGSQVVSLNFHATATGTTPGGQQATLVVVNNAVSGPVVLGRTPKPIPMSDFGFTAVVINVQVHGSAPAAVPTGPLAAPPLSAAHTSHTNAVDPIFASPLGDPLGGAL
jgi:hypothetical protein